LAFIVITLHNRPDLGTVTAHIHAHGVRQGRYGDLWELRQELTPEGGGANGALLALARRLEEICGRSDVDGLAR
jgi:hypothetical protein